MSKIEIILFFSFFFHFIKSQNRELILKDEEKAILNITTFAIQLAHATLMELLRSRELNISQDCVNIINETYYNPNSPYYHIFYYDSSKSKNDLGSYTDCLNGNMEYYYGEKEKLKENITFIVANIKEKGNKDKITKNDTSEEENNYLLGFCVINGCSSEDYQQIFISVNRDIQFFHNNLTISVYNLKENKSCILIIMECIPLFIVIIIFLFSLFPFIPGFLFQSCVKSHNRKEDIKSCFNFVENMDELLSTNQLGKNLITNDMGLLVIKGIKSLTLILVLCSESFQQLYQLPTKIYSSKEFSLLLKNVFFTFVQFGDRYGIRLLYGISGFILSFKMLYYLDNEIEKNDDNSREKQDDENDENEKENEENLNKIINGSSVSLEGNIIDLHGENHGISFNENFYNINRKFLSNQVLFKFIFRQFYKYVMFIITVFYFKYCLIKEFYIFDKNGSPLWTFCQKEILDKFNITQILGNIFLFSPFFKSSYFLYNPFDIVYNEIFFFLFGSILIFYSYKNLLRLDLIIIILFIIFEFGKLILFALLLKTEKFYPIKFFQDTEYSYIISNQLYNMPSMLIGLLFGMVNYCIQNSGKANENAKKFLKIPKLILTFVKKEDCIKFILLLIFLIILIGSSLIFFILINIGDTETDNTPFFKNTIYNIIFLYDFDIGIIATFFLIIQNFLLGSTYIMGFFSHEYWGLISRPYFTYILLVDLLSFLILYQSEHKIKLELFHIFFFSFEIFIVLLIVQVIIFVFVEIPLKKLNKLILEPNDSRKIIKKEK